MSFFSWLVSYLGGELGRPMAAEKAKAGAWTITQIDVELLPAESQALRRAAHGKGHPRSDRTLI